jgi:signal transduction histidine kinase
VTIAITWVIFNAILGAASVVIMIGLTYYAWSRRHDVKGGQIFTLLMLCEAVRIAGYTLEIVSPSAAMSLTASKIQYVGVFSVLLWFVFTLNFAGYGGLSQRLGRIIAVLPITVALLAFTNEFHGLIWGGVSVERLDAFYVFRAEYGSFFYVYFVYTAVLLIVGVIVLLRAQARRWRLYRWQMILWLAGTLIPAFGHYAMVFSWYIIPTLHPIPLTYMIGAVLLTVAVFRLRLIDVMPIPFDTIFNSSPNPVIVYDLKRRIVALNPAGLALADVPRSSVIGSPLDCAFPALVEALNADGGEVHLRGADYTVLRSPSRTRGGKVRGQILILTDITLIRQAERAQQALLGRISRLEQLKTEMIRLAAHDLKNPLTTISGYVAVMQSEDPAAPLSSAGEHLAVIERAAESMLRMVTDILSLDRIERMAGDQTLHSLDLARLVKTTADELDKDAALKGLTYSAAVGAEPLCVRGDPVQLHEAITNLIANAIKYTPSGGDVRVCVYLEGAQVVFEVADTGPGIPESMQAKLFQPFYRAKTPETARIDGTGLGLYLVKGIIERHSGALILKSEYGRGSTFGFRLPAYRKPDAA